MTLSSSRTLSLVVLAVAYLRAWSIPNGLWIEDMGLAEDLFVHPVPVVNGVIRAPERPGHGLAFKPEILRDCAVRA